MGWDDAADEGADFPDTECIRESGKAILVTRGRREMWVPKSVIHDDSEVYEDGHHGTLVLQTWWAEKEGLL
jgi:hypothetical protein